MDMLEIARELPQTPGVYLMKDEEAKILYIGKAKCLRNRVSSYFQKSAEHAPKIALMVKKVCDIEVLETDSEVDALILESKLIKDLQPKYNTRQKDSKSYPFIGISKREDFPKVVIGREHELSAKQYKLFGPFIDGYGLKVSFKLLQKIFKFRTCDLDIKEGDPKNKYYRPCLLAAIKYCSAPCVGRITSASYKKDMQGFSRFLQGKSKRLLKNLHKDMDEASRQWDYETAAKIRDQIAAIKSLDKKGTQGDYLPGEHFDVNPVSALKMLQEVLELDTLPNVIEGIDIAHHGGKEAVGSLVTFVGGFPYKEGYRRYRIKVDAHCNDYRMLQEVFTRRFTGQDKKRDAPDVFLVDGGKGQLSAIIDKMQKLDVPLPMVISLAKKNEEIFLPGAKKPLPLPKNSLAHHLLCHVRDEAHRFAQSYHHFLKKQRF
ncbi:UvrB/UvrC motif-containing protein [Candidatus Uabimicrobium amorphum]|uniref:UvrABC system protein C n=1 Tax=Uabimicrobium amorphum TaxID=2596890 RepID=A0A5S9IP30_UABAM|nr:excinuclease ABC subunit UvrC [Candidatus Uabimicrobium amorphum]BBM85439.1 UvrABC system protein C [Candidatus Uabimicrobium amorphum]